jgi:hypothetical protein
MYGRFLAARVDVRTIEKMDPPDYVHRASVEDFQ